MMNGINRVEFAFQLANSQHRAALMPYFTLGFPDPESSIGIIECIAKNGADILELGIPFSDPIADGPTIQYSTQVALNFGINSAKCLEMVRELRAKGVEQPILLMGYYNPILNYGIDRFVVDSAQVGVDGFIIPDLPPEEAHVINQACTQNRCALVYLASPTTSFERIEFLGRNTKGFLYLVSLRGVTGARGQLPEDLEEFIKKVKSTTNQNIAVGFGISNEEQVSKISKLADGIIIGSRLIQEVTNSDDPKKDISNLMRLFRQAVYK
jgi:tryptophan synthase alpha chain